MDLGRHLDQHAGGRPACPHNLTNRVFGVLKHEWGVLPLRVRRLPRVRLHVDLTILARLASALTKARAVPLAALLAA